MRTRYRHLVGCCVLLLLFGAGCAANLPVYTGPVGPPASSLKPYTVEKAQFALPPGWTFEAPDPNKENLTGFTKMLTGKGTVGMLKKETKGKTVGGALALFCWGGFVSKSDLPEIHRSNVKDAMPDAVLLKAFQLETDNTPLPEFEVYSGTMVVDGVKVPMRGYSASKWTYGFGCKYGISGFAPAAAGDAFEQDFIAIVRSLKN